MADYENGKIPPSLLRRVSNFRPLYASVTSAAGSDLLREDAWAALNVLQAEFYKRFERSLNVSEAYRGLTRQTAVWQQYINGDGPMAARPGTSNHGWGVAVDFGSDVDSFNSATKYWMARNAPRWGWHPVGNDFARPEAWHFEFKPKTATETIPSSGGATLFPEGDAALSAEEVAQINAYTEAAAQVTRNLILDKLAIIEGVARHTDAGAAEATVAAKASANSAEQARTRIGADLDGRLAQVSTDAATKVWATVVTEDGKAASSIQRQTWERSGDASKRASTIIVHLKTIAAKAGAVLRTDLPE